MRKRKSLYKNDQNKNVVNTFIQPFKEMPSTTGPGQKTTDRMNAHDLFSLYTADIIKEDVVFSR